MRTLGFIPFDKARMALSNWRTWPATARRMQEIRVLERRVAASRFGVNSPQTFHRLPNDEHVQGRRALTLP